jgi:hypothetical protein
VVKSAVECLHLDILVLFQKLENSENCPGTGQAKSQLESRFAQLHNYPIYLKMLASIKSKLKPSIQSIRRFSRKDRLIEEQAREEAQQRI